ncbi:SDR family NAD(P)-dependent oxidoreductase [Hydrogenophaga sp. 2FB]|uniref:SDR family NAD(P)-dependent oxidoreductase n=1 Tax=Hydrogenophaga sp. 2FB TaxID=2502187 RepID=UPI0010FA1068|nr:SDR family NAD(P)-dependent oxidoreductase [Hydrogenophaga sp. 2FB]
MKKLDGKVALVTGSGRGIGQALALKLASDGARLVINDLDAEPAHETVALLKGQGVDAVACVGSVTAPDFAERFIKTAVDSFGGVDIIVNNAGYTWDNVIQKMTDEQWHAIINCHLTAPFQILRAAYPVISAAAKKEAAEGREVFRKVVNISSNAGLNGNPGQSNYAAAKAGMVGLTKTLAKEWGRMKVNVNCVAFGLITTRLTDTDADGGATVNIEGKNLRVGLNPELLKSHAMRCPLGRPGTAQEAAAGVSLYCGPESDYITGQVIAVSGGI